MSDTIISPDKTLEKKKRGRPRGSKKGLWVRRSPRWTPKEFKPQYELMVYDRVAGLSNKEIAAKYDYTEVQVSNILTLPQAKELETVIKDRIRQTFLGNVTEDMEVTTKAAMQNIKGLLTDEEMAKKAPFAMFDKSMKFMQAAGKLVGDVPKGDHHEHKTFIMGDDLAKRLIDGIEKAARVKERYSIANKVEIPVPVKQIEAQNGNGTGEQG